MTDSPADTTDPVLARRARIAAASRLGKRVGYGCYALAVVLFFVGFAAGWSDGLVAVIVVAMAAGAIVLIPAIIFAYGVKAAEREERESGR